MDHYQPLCVRNVIVGEKVEVVDWVKGEREVIDMDVEYWISEDLSKPLCPPLQPLFPIQE
tara:strand:+ start:915 stop:1094 length:180 start_codon:yes stop_codon:yes gene_type:complete